MITVLGPNRFGKDGSLYCDSGLLPGTTSCEGLLFCLPDPFGCICGAGYKGIDCNTGTVGACKVQLQSSKPALQSTRPLTLSNWC